MNRRSLNASILPTIFARRINNDRSDFCSDNLSRDIPDFYNTSRSFLTAVRQTTEADRQDDKVPFIGGGTRAGR
ncbi:MAG TPA: hypothetical protein PKJ24_07200 [Prolixibacteraceae bacterium]|nr:hypothetical protein [Prolixibacteraceae bacterium]